MASFSWWYCPCLSCWCVNLCSLPSSGCIKSRCIHMQHFVNQVSRNLGFQGLSWIMYAFMQIFARAYTLFLLGFIPASVQLGYKINQCLTVGNWQTSSEVVTPCSSNRMRVPASPHLSLPLLPSSIPVANSVTSLLMYLLAVCVSSLLSYLLQPLPIFKLNSLSSNNLYKFEL